MKLSRLALAVALAPCTSVFAETPSREAAMKLDDVIITANREVQTRSESSAAVSIFTRADIERLRPADINELLVRVPGVQVVQNGGRGSNTSLFIRGTGTAQSLVLIDGQRAGSVSSGGASLQYLNVEQIERIEVLRGSRSAVYGADAIGGVVQIFTRRGEVSGVNPYLRIAGGSQGTWERSLGVSGGDQRTSYSLNASLEETTGIDRSGPSWVSDSDHDAYRNRAFSINLSHNVNDDLQVGFSALEQRGKSEYDNPYGRKDAFWNTYPTKPYTDYSLSSTSVFTEAQINEHWSSRLELGHAEDKQDGRDKLFSGSDTFNSYRDSATWLNTLTLNSDHSLLIGADYLNDKLRSNTDYNEDERWNQAGFIQHSYHGERFSTELGLRHDKNQQYGSENTWNVALTAALNAHNDLIFSYAEGFRAPTFNDLYWPADPVFGASSNPNLAPEKSKSYELQWRSQLAEHTRLEASIYRTDIHDLIAYVWNPATSEGLNYNVNEARINGFEASLHQQLLGWQGVLGLSVIDPRDRDSEHTLQRRAKQTLSLDIDRRIGNIGVGATWQTVSRRFDDAANTREIAGYGVLDLRASWHASQELAFDLKLNNLLDKGYSHALYQYDADKQYYGYQEQPFGMMLGVTWTPSL